MSKKPLAIVSGAGGGLGQALMDRFREGGFQVDTLSSSLRFLPCSVLMFLKSRSSLLLGTLLFSALLSPTSKALCGSDYDYADCTQLEDLFFCSLPRLRFFQKDDCLCNLRKRCARRRACQDVVRWFVEGDHNGPAFILHPNMILCTLPR